MMRNHTLRAGLSITMGFILIGQAEGNTNITFRSLSVETVQEYDWWTAGQRNTVSVSDDKRILVVKFSISNNGDKTQKFTSAEFSIRDQNGKLVESQLIGVGNNIGADNSTVTVNYNAIVATKGGVCGSYSGTLGGGRSLVTWTMNAHSTHESTLAFTVPSAQKQLQCNFGKSDKPNKALNLQRGSEQGAAASTNSTGKERAQDILLYLMPKAPREVVFTIEVSAAGELGTVANGEPQTPTAASKVTEKFGKPDTIKKNQTAQFVPASSIPIPVQVEGDLWFYDEMILMVQKDQVKYLWLKSSTLDKDKIIGQSPK